MLVYGSVGSESFRLFFGSEFSVRDDSKTGRDDSGTDTGSLRETLQARVSDELDTRGRLCRTRLKARGGRRRGEREGTDSRKRG